MLVVTGRTATPWAPKALDNSRATAAYRSSEDGMHSCREFQAARHGFRRVAATGRSASRGFRIMAEQSGRNDAVRRNGQPSERLTDQPRKVYGSRESKPEDVAAERTPQGIERHKVGHEPRCVPVS